MTSLKRPISRSIGHRVSHAIKPLVVTLYPDGIIGLREKGRRKEYQVDIGRLYLNAVAQEVQERKRKKKRGSYLEDKEGV